MSQGANDGLGDDLQNALTCAGAAESSDDGGFELLLALGEEEEAVPVTASSTLSVIKAATAKSGPDTFDARNYFPAKAKPGTRTQLPSAAAAKPKVWAEPRAKQLPRAIARAAAANEPGSASASGYAHAAVADPATEPTTSTVSVAAPVLERGPRRVLIGGATSEIVWEAPLRYYSVWVVPSGSWLKVGVWCCPWPLIQQLLEGKPLPESGVFLKGFDGIESSISYLAAKLGYTAGSQNESINIFCLSECEAIIKSFRIRHPVTFQ